MYRIKIESQDLRNKTEGPQKALDWSQLNVTNTKGKTLENVKSVTLKIKAGEFAIVEIERYVLKEDKDFPSECVWTEAKDSITTNKISFPVQYVLIETTNPFVNKPTKGNDDAIHKKRTTRNVRSQNRSPRRRNLLSNKE